MTYNEVWCHNDSKDNFMKIMGKNENGSISVTFDLNHFIPKRTHNYEQWYIEKFYTNTGETHQWTISDKLIKID